MIPLCFVYFSSFKSLIEKVKNVAPQRSKGKFEEEEAKINEKMSFLNFKICLRKLGHLYFNIFLVSLNLF